MKAVLRFRLRDAGWLLLASLLGGLVALALAIVALAVRYYARPEPAQAGYMNPSAAVGEGLETVYWAASIWAIGAICGAAAYVIRRSRR